ncbi:Uma2 family endonuclease [Crossiella equi]|uniref:Uma2 family endonuclease n=1 Tax=Crossiella equi TaxID=130796 RepID=A0ABS5A6P3_9PSEU|nr:Uma2 family endonuclease [Crossiella equi]MBP2472265.1 Uma2 family endonuclease [Crossiella equi]
MTAPGLCTGDPISVTGFDGLPVDNAWRLEIEDGRLLVRGRPSGAHILAAQRLARQLDDALPLDLESLVEIQAELRGPSPRRIPDLVVCVAEVGEQVRVRADQILLAVEIHSPGESAARDYLKKPAEYAANGIPATWVVDIREDPITLTVYTLDGTSRYCFHSPVSHSYTDTIGGHEVTIDLDALTGPRRRHG